MAGCLGLLASLQACPRVVEPAASPGLPVYSPAEAALFDDTFSADIFASAAVEPPLSNEKLRERVVLADSVVQARITTVTRDMMGRVRGYTLIVTPTGSALAGARWTEPIEILITRESPAFVRVGAAEAALVNKHLILFVRRYDAGDGEQLHWRAESDTEAVRTAVRQATAVRAARAEH